MESGWEKRKGPRRYRCWWRLSRKRLVPPITQYRKKRNMFQKVRGGVQAAHNELCHMGKHSQAQEREKEVCIWPRVAPWTDPLLQEVLGGPIPGILSLRYWQNPSYFGNSSPILMFPLIVLLYSTLRYILPAGLSKVVFARVPWETKSVKVLATDFFCLKGNLKDWLGCICLCARLCGKPWKLISSMNESKGIQTNQAHVRMS